MKFTPEQRITREQFGLGHPGRRKRHAGFAVESCPVGAHQAALSLHLFIKSRARQRRKQAHGHAINAHSFTSTQRIGKHFRGVGIESTVLNWRWRNWWISRFSGVMSSTLFLGRLLSNIFQILHIRRDILMSWTGIRRRGISCSTYFVPQSRTRNMTSCSKYSMTVCRTQAPGLANCRSAGT